MTGSSTRHGTSGCASSVSATVSMTAAEPSIPILIASMRTSAKRFSIWVRTSSGVSRPTASTPWVFCAMTAVTTPQP